MTLLGFKVAKVQTQPDETDRPRFVVTLQKPANGKKSNYTHPISAFGSEAEEKGFRVVCLFGRFDAARLRDTFRELGNTKHTLIVLDYALPLAERQLLARYAKVGWVGKTFAVIDRVVITYLAPPLFGHGDQPHAHGRDHALCQLSALCVGFRQGDAAGNLHGPAEGTGSD